MQTAHPAGRGGARPLLGLRLTESAVMLAFAVILSMIAIVKMPYGGDITAFSMLPIVIIAYRYGTGWGLFTGFVFSLLQMIMGTNNLAWATSAWAGAMIILLDYVVAFTVIGLAGVFRKIIPSQGGAMAAGTVLACVLRYACHVLVGFFVWRDISIPVNDAFWFSMGYNAAYMVPETLITVVAAVYVSQLLDFRSQTITRAAAREKSPDLAVLLAGVGKALLAAAAVFDIVEIFTTIQISGGFDAAQLAHVNWALVAGVTVGAGALAAVLTLGARRVPADHALSLRGLFDALPFVGVVIAAEFNGAMIARLIAHTERGFYDWLEAAFATLAVAAAAVLVIRRFIKKHA